MRLKDYGVRVYRQGIDFRADSRRRDLKGEAFIIPFRFAHWAHSKRGEISGLSKASAKRLEFIAANVRTPLTTLLTLTYRENAAEGETEKDRNLRVARRSKADLNRFLSCVRFELGAYLWVQEFQERGVVHYHLLCEKPIGEARVRLVWCRAINALGDKAALRHGVKVESVANPLGARSYVGRYFGKERQKKLPPGVEQAGRWWGRSRSMDLDVLTEVISWPQGAQGPSYVDVWVLRQLRRYMRSRLGWKFKSGVLIDWGGSLSASINRIVPELRQWFIDYNERVTSNALKLLEKYGWELDEKETDRLLKAYEKEYEARLRDDPEAAKAAKTKWARLWLSKAPRKEWTQDEIARDMGEPSRAMREWIAEGEPVPELDPQVAIELGDMPLRVGYPE